MTRLPSGQARSQERPLDSWEFTLLAEAADWRSLPADAWQSVAVPHVAESALDDVRRGGRVAYRVTVPLEPGPGCHELRFDGVSYRCEVYLDGQPAAAHEGAWDPFTVHLDGPLGSRAVDVCVVVDLADFDEASPFHFRNVLLGFVPDTMGPFGGLWREVTYRYHPSGHLREVGIAVDNDAPGVRVQWSVCGTDDAAVEISVETQDGSRIGQEVVEARQRRTAVRARDATFWTPASPALHRVRARLLDSGGSLLEETERMVGFRRVGVRGRKILLEDDEIYLRGILHWGFYPALRAPSPDRACARRELEFIRSLGFNAVKFCLFMPPEHYFELCDELGILVWQELPLWLPQDRDLVEERIRDQYPKLVDLIAHHPSLLLVSLGCELDETVSTATLDWAYELVRSRVPDAIVCANSGSGECFGGGVGAKSDIYDYHFYADPHELDQLLGEFTRESRAPRPWLFGEYNDADTWRTVETREDGAASVWLVDDPAVNPLLSVHAGFASEPQLQRRAEIIAAEGYGAELEGLEELSEKEAFDVRKLVWEQTRSYAAIGGYVVTGLRDVAGSTSGLLDWHGHPKFDANAVAQINAPTVMTLLSPLRRHWYRGGDRLRKLDPYNAVDGEEHAFTLALASSASTHGPGLLELRLESNGRLLAAESSEVVVSAHDVRELAEVSWLPRRLDNRVAAEAELSAALSVDDRLICRNKWPLLIHPRLRPWTDVLLHDPSGRLDGLAALSGARRIVSELELAEALESMAPGAVLLTTAYSDSLRLLTTEVGAQTFVVDDGHYFAMEQAPFWRENVKRVHPDTWLRSAIPTEHAGTPLGAVAGDSYIPRSELRDRLSDYTPLISRYDARSYRVGEYMFEWREGAARTVWSTLRLAGGTGTQPRLVQDDVLALSILDAFVTTAAQRRDRPSSANAEQVHHRKGATSC